LRGKGAGSGQPSIEREGWFTRNISRHQKKGNTEGGRRNQSGDGPMPGSPKEKKKKNYGQMSLKGAGKKRMLKQGQGNWKEGDGRQRGR